MSRGEDQDDDTIVVEIEGAIHHLHDLEKQLLELQKRCLARGTRDVMEQAHEAVKKVTLFEIGETD